MTATDPVRPRATAKQFSPGDAPGATSSEGWVTFAGVMLAMLAALNFIDGVAAVSDSRFFVNGATFILSDLNTWGWILILTGLVQGAAAAGVWLKTKGARWLGVAIAAVNAIVQMFFISAYPFWALCLFTLDILVIYALVVHGARSSISR